MDEIEVINGYNPSDEGYKNLSSIHSIIESYDKQNDQKIIKINQSDLDQIKESVQNLKRESFSQILYMDETILYDLLAFDEVFSEIAPILEEKNVRMNFFSDITRQNLLMRYFDKYNEDTDKAIQNMDFLLTHGCDLHSVNNGNKNIVDYLPNSHHEFIDNPTAIIDLYQVIKKHNNGQNIMPGNWDNFVFNMYTIYPESTINSLEEEMGINFLDQIDDSVKYYIAHQCAEYSIKFNPDQATKEQEKSKIFNVIDSMDDKKVILDQFNFRTRWCNQKSVYAERYNKNPEDDNLKIDEKKFNIMTASGFDSALFKQLMNRYQNLFTKKDSEYLISYLDKNMAMEDTSEQFKNNLRQSKAIFQKSRLKLKINSQSNSANELIKTNKHVL